MLLSVVIVSYNTKEILIECLQSAYKALDQMSSEVFVVDNDSLDGTVESIKTAFPKTILIANKENIGFSKANNIAIKRAKGKYVLVLNPDTKVLKDTFVKMVELMEKNTKIGIATCRVELASGGLDKDCRRHFPSPWKAFCHFAGLSKIFRRSKLFDSYYYGYIPETKEHEVDACVGAFMIIRKKDLDKVGYFDEDFFFYGEDLDLCYRFRQAGHKIIYTPITKIIHYKGAASGIKPPSMHLSKATLKSKERAVRESTRAMELFYQKHYVGKYPAILTWLVIFSVKILEYYRLFKIRYLL